MKFKQIKLQSLVSGAFGSDAAGISLLYSFLLYKFSFKLEKSIIINHIDNRFNEGILKFGGHYTTNIIKSEPNDILNLTSTLLNKFYVEVIEEAFLKNSDTFKVGKELMEKVKLELYEHDFNIDVPLKKFICNKNQYTLIVRPNNEFFDYYLTFPQNINDKIFIYRGIPSLFYVNEIFSNCKKYNEDTIVITGQQSNVEILINILNYVIEYKKNDNISPVDSLFYKFKLDR